MPASMPVGGRGFRSCAQLSVFLATLRMQEAMPRYADTLRAKGCSLLMMRVGINTGEVVLRSIHKDDLPADCIPGGHSTNLGDAHGTRSR